jgi:hypothetical protein
MTAPRDPDRLIRAFLGEGQTELPDRTYDAVRSEIDRTHQRVVIGPWRAPHMSNFARIAIMAAAVLAVAVLGVNLVRPGMLNPIGAPSPSPSPTASPIPLRALGPMEPGTYAIAPIGGDDVTVSFTVPTGWGHADWAIEKPSGATASGLNQNGQMWLSFWTVANTYRDPCRWMNTALDPPLGPTVQDLVTALRAQAGSNATAPSAVRIGPYVGQRMTIDIPTDQDASTCDGGRNRLWITPDGGERSTGAFSGFHRVLWIVDVDGIRVVVEGDYGLNATDQERAEIEAIMASIQVSPR